MFDQNKFVLDGLKALINSDTNRGYITRWAMSAYSSGILSTDNMGELQRMLDVRDGILIDYEDGTVTEPEPESDIVQESEPDIVTESEPDIVTEQEPDIVTESEPDIVTE